jgi:hypothetical protein
MVAIVDANNHAIWKRCNYFKNMLAEKLGKNLPFFTPNNVKISKIGFQLYFSF